MEWFFFTSTPAISRYRGNAHSLKCYCPQETFQLEVSKILELQVLIALYIDAPFEVMVCKCYSEVENSSLQEKF